MFTISFILKSNAINCLLFGVLFLLAPSDTSAFLSQAKPAPESVVLFIGAVLTLNGVHLLWVAAKNTPPKIAIYYFSLDDIAWVILTVFLITTGTWITSSGGIAVSALVASLVGLFGWAQLNLARATNDERPSST